MKEEWIYTYKVKFLDEDTFEEVVKNGFVVATGMREAYDKISDFYGEDNIFNIFIESVDSVYSICFEMSESDIKYLKERMEA